MITQTCLIILASGQSSRFGGENKLLANLNGKPLAAYSALLWASHPSIEKVAIVPHDCPQLDRIYREKNWSIVRNKHPKRGQSLSVKHGVAFAKSAGAQSVIISLADMPFVSDSHINAIAEELKNCSAVMSQYGSVNLPPAGFRKSKFNQLLSIEGDRGAASVFEKSDDRVSLTFPTPELIDIDTVQDLRSIKSKRTENV